MDGYKYLLSSRLNWFDHYPIKSITSAHINRFRAELLNEGLAAKTVTNTLNLLGRIFKDAIADSYLRHSPMQGVERPKSKKKRHGRALKPEEIKGLLEALDSESRLLVLTAILTGLRQGEQYALRWEDIDFDNAVIRVRRQLYWRFGPGKKDNNQKSFEFVTPKTDRSVRDIDLSPTLKKELMALYLKSGDKEGLVFRSRNGGPLNGNNIAKRKFKPACKVAGIEGNVRWHDLRHTFGSLKIEQGANVYYIQRQMGHASIQVTMDVYGHLLESRKPGTHPLKSLGFDSKLRSAILHPILKLIPGNHLDGRGARCGVVLSFHLSKVKTNWLSSVPIPNR
jgi:integrase